MSQPLHCARTHSVHSMDVLIVYVFSSLRVPSNYINLRTSIWVHCLFFLCVCICICLCLWGVHTCVRVHRDQPWALLLRKPSILYFETGILTCLELADLIRLRLAGKGSLGILLSPPLRCWDYGHIPPFPDLLLWF